MDPKKKKELGTVSQNEFDLGKAAGEFVRSNANIIKDNVVNNVGKGIDDTTRAVGYYVKPKIDGAIDGVNSIASASKGFATGLGLTSQQQPKPAQAAPTPQPVAQTTSITDSNPNMTTQENVKLRMDRANQSAEEFKKANPYVPLQIQDPVTSKQPSATQPTASQVVQPIDVRSIGSYMTSTGGNDLSKSAYIKTPEQEIADLRSQLNPSDRLDLASTMQNNNIMRQISTLEKQQAFNNSKDVQKRNEKMEQDRLDLSRRKDARDEALYGIDLLERAQRTSYEDSLRRAIKEKGIDSEEAILAESLLNKRLPAQQKEYAPKYGFITQKDQNGNETVLVTNERTGEVYDSKRANPINTKTMRGPKGEMLVKDPKSGLWKEQYIENGITKYREYSGK